MKSKPCIARWTLPGARSWWIAPPERGNRQKIDARIEELLGRKEGFVAIVMWISNIKRLEASCSNTLINVSMKAMVQRVSAVVGEEVMIGRWSQDQLAMLLDIDSVEAVALSNDLGQKLSSR